MGHRRTSLMLLGGVLLLGVIAGTALDQLRVTSEAQAAGDTARPRGGAATVAAPFMGASQHMARIAAVTTPAVVHIQSVHEEDGKRIEETGSGVLMQVPSRSGVFVITNSHVVRGASYEDIQIHTASGRSLNPTRVREDRATDIAVMDVPGRDLPTVTWGDSDTVDIGHVVLAMGSPFGLSRSVTFGIISAKGRRDLKLAARPADKVINQDFLQTDAAINPGNSGGPLIDLNGHVIGINTAIASNSGGNEGIGFSIPVNLVRRVVTQLLTHGRVRRAYLGVVLDPAFTAERASRMGLSRLRGARVTTINKDTPAYRAGIRLNDVVLTFNGIEITDENHLINLVSLSEVGTRAQLIVLRGGKQVRMQVVLTERPREERVSSVNPKPGVRRMSLRVTDLTDSLASQLGLEQTSTGLLVMSVPSGSDGLQLYDVITEAAGQPVTSINALEEATAGCDGGLLLKIRRQGQTDPVLTVYHAE